MAPTTITVPDEIAGEVRRFAAFLLSEQAGTQGTTSAEQVEIVDHIADYPLWLDEDIIKLANAGTSTAGHYRAIMDAVITHGKVGAWVSLDDLAEWTGIKRSTVSTFRTHLYRYVNSHLPKGSMAPFTATSGQNLRPARGRDVYYRVSGDCAAQWARVQSALTEVK